jgi:hypothetical protein
VKIVFLKGFYKLEEIDKTKLKETHVRNYLKKFVYKKDTFILINYELESDLDKTNSLDKSKSWEEVLIISKKTKRALAIPRNLINKVSWS